MSRGASSSSSPSSAHRGRSRSETRRSVSDRPICFKLEQRFKPLRFPEIRETLKAALRARATGTAEISYVNQECKLTPQDDGSWPVREDVEDGEEAGEASKWIEGEAGPNAEFLVLRTLGRASPEQISQLCRQLLDMDLPVLTLSSRDPVALYLVASSSQTQQIVESLLQEGHGLRPGNEVCGQPNANVLAAAGLSSLGELHLSKNFKPQDLERFAGAWVEVEESTTEPVDGEGGLRSIIQRARRLRFVSRHGLFAEVHFLGDSGDYRAVAGCFTFKDESCWAPESTAEDKGGVKVSCLRRIAVDTEPMRSPSDASHHPVSEVCDDEMHDIAEGASWRRIAKPSNTPIAAAELLMEQAQGPGSKTPVFGLRAGVWIVCGEVALQVLGPPRGEGLIGGTMCQSMEQLQAIENPEAINDELQNCYEGSTGVLTVKGCITRDRGVGAAGNAKGSLLCGATPKSEIGFKTASILYSTGLMTKGGSITLESPSGSFTQVWRIRELEENPFDSPTLRQARKIPTGALTSPSAAVVRVASNMAPKGKGKGGKGKGKLGKGGKGRGRAAAPAPAFAATSLPVTSVAFTRAPIGTMYGTPRALTVYGGAAPTAPPPRLGSRPPGRPIGTLQKVDYRPSPKGRGRGGPRSVTLSEGTRRNRSRSAEVRREPQGSYRSTAPARDGRDNGGRRHRSPSRGHGSRRSRSRRRGRKS